MAGPLSGLTIVELAGTLAEIVTRMLGDTHHAPILENWGLLWMWHAVVLLVLCLVTNAMQWRGVDQPGPYLLLWLAALLAGCQGREKDH